MIREDLVTEWRKGHRQPGLTELAACQRLRSLAAAVPADQAIVELGAYAGRTTGWLLLGAQDGYSAPVVSVDPWGERTDGYDRYSGRYIEAERLHAEHMTRIGATPEQHTAVRGRAVDVGTGWVSPPVGLLWHDAEHSADAVEADLRAWLPHLSPTAVVVLHDAANPRCGVVEGAGRVLDTPGWDWPGELLRWQRKPDKRGALIVRRVP